jgi:Zn-dependent protease with chaperone function
MWAPRARPPDAPPAARAPAVEARARAQGLKWEFVVIRDDTANAFVLPGGKVRPGWGHVCGALARAPARRTMAVPRCL